MKNQTLWKLGGIATTGLILATLGYTAVPGYALLAYYAGRTVGKSEHPEPTSNDNDSAN